ncbi:MAG: sodium-translocating pyrophosphatase, partial [Actinomycetota bacterium]|nr:sodium-translocating pyrophosphatase [Actinomycetota bacterium]
MFEPVVAFLAAVVALGWGARLFAEVLRAPATHVRAGEIAQAIAQGAQAFLRRQYGTVALVGGPIFVLVWLVFGSWVAAGFALGAVASALAGFIGMHVSVRANVRVAEAAGSGFSGAFDLAFKGGAVTGLMVVGLGLGSLASLVFAGRVLIDDPSARMPTLSHALVGLAFGGSLISVFARLGGGIFTKAADVGADLVGKVERDIPEDDPRNPATIADNVGDNVGDCAGMAADLFETYCVTAAAVMLLATILFDESGDSASSLFHYPLMVGTLGIVGSVVALPFVRITEPPPGGVPDVMGAMYRGLGVASAVLVGTLLVVTLFFDVPDVDDLGHGLSELRVWLCAVIGVVVTFAMLWVTNVFTGDGSKQVGRIAEASEGGHGTNVIAGLAVGMQATAVPVGVIVLAILLSHGLAGLYGVGIAAMAMLSLAGLIVSIDSYGPITDNAGGIAEMAELGDDVRAVTDPLDAFGNTTKAVTKGYAIASAGLAAVVLFSVFIEDLEKGGVVASFDLANVSVVAGLLLGAMLPFVFASFAMNAVGVAGTQVVEEVRRQFREKPGIMDRTEQPDYARCVDIVTKAALREMIVPALIPVAVPIAVALTPGFGAEAMGGMLIGSIVSGVCLALSMTTGGAAWDNAKKLIETGVHG